MPEILSDKNVFSTFEAAKICNSSIMSINRWIHAGELKSYRTPGGHHRIPKDDLISFLKRNNIPFSLNEFIHKWKILVVDDDELVLSSIVKNLRKFCPDFEVISANSGYEAGILVAQFSPHVIILDIMMPHMDGFKVCESIKSNPEKEDIIIVVITGYGNKENEEKAYNCGANKVFFKPIKSTKLVSEIRIMLKHVHR